MCLVQHTNLSIVNCSLCFCLCGVLMQLAGAVLTACFIYLLYKEEEEDFGTL